MNHSRRWCLFAACSLLLSGSLSQAAVYSLNVNMSGLQEVPPNGSPATGTLSGTYDDGSKILAFSLTFSGLTSPDTAAHFHGPAGPGVNAGVLIAFPAFPTGVTSGNYSNSFVLTTQQEGYLLANLMYVNIHTSTFPGGEIRGQLQPVPEPGVTLCGALGLLGLSLRRRR